MLSVSNNGETCSNHLCQHPQCWQTKVRLVRQAVRRRNGVKNNEQRRHVQPKPQPVFANKEGQRSLPTLKIVDVTREIGSSEEEDYNDDNKQQNAYRTYWPPSSRVSRSKPCRPASFSTHAPNPTPVSPTSTEPKKLLILKGQSQAVFEEREKKKPKKINFHEIYDYNEIYDDWKDTFVSTAYLVWCPSEKKKKTGNSRACSALTDYRTRGFKNFIDDVLPLPTTVEKPKKRSHKYPTGGQPYTPCKSPLTKQDYYRPADYLPDGDYIMTVAEENVPPSLITTKKVLEIKENYRNKDFQLHNVNSTKVLVDISSQLSLSNLDTQNNNREDSESRKIDEGHDDNIMAPKATTHEVDDKKRSYETEQDETAKYAQRRAMHLPSVGIPWGLIPTRERYRHCRSSIPHDKDLGVIMEPVVYVPRSARKDKVNTMGIDSTEEDILTKENVDITKSYEQLDERDHLTSAYRFSPTNLCAPAPTPNTPQTRDTIRRQKSLARMYPNRSMVTDASIHCITHREDVGQEIETAPGRAKSRTSDERAINDVHETNTSTTETKCQQHGGRFKAREKSGAKFNSEKLYDLDASLSLRAVSPSSRTNIPPDIWAELQANVLDDVKPMMTRGYRNSLDTSGYTYTEAVWKPSGTKLPRAFNTHRSSLGPYSQTILPRMPASLTIVPVPSVQKGNVRSATGRRRHTYTQATSTNSIKIPVVPAASPALTDTIGAVDLGPLLGETREGVKGRYAEAVEEYIVARDVMSPTEDPESNRETTLEISSYEEIAIYVSTTSESACCSSDATKEDAESGKKESQEPQGPIADNSQEFVAPDRSFAIIESDHSCNRIMHGADESEEVDLDTTTAETVLGISYEERASMDNYANESNEQQLSGYTDTNQPDDFKDKQVLLSSRGADNTTILNDKSLEAGSTSDISTTNLDTSTSDPDTSTSKPDTLNAKQDVSSNTESTDISPSNHNMLANHPDVSTGTNNSNTGTSSESILSNVGSEIQLEAFKVESDLLLPIVMESDLLLLTDSFLDLSFDEDNLGDTNDNVGDG